MIDLNLYTYTGNTNVIKKNLLTPHNIKGKIRDRVESMALSILLEFKGLLPFNYCYIKQLKKYYYIENVEYYPNNLCNLLLKQDVLMTYKDCILNSKGKISKTEIINPFSQSIGYSEETKTETEIHSSDLKVPIETKNILVTIVGQPETSEGVL